MKTTDFLEKKAIVGCAFNYRTAVVLPFLNSLERVGFKGDLILFVNNQTSIELSKYSYQVILVNPEKEFASEMKTVQLLHRMAQKARLQRQWTALVFRSVLQRIRRGQNIRRWVTAFFYSSYNLMTSRFFLYYFYLKNKAYTSVLFTDVTDVIFQNDPFFHTDTNNVYAFSENDASTIGENYHNQLWIQQGFGEEVLQKMHREPIYCAGTIIAGGKIVLSFLKDFMTIVLKHRISPVIEGIDQGVFNYMISCQQKPYFRLQDNGEHVFTLGLVPDSEVIERNGNLFLRGKENHLPAIVHQYNRHPELIERVQERYAKTPPVDAIVT